MPKIVILGSCKYEPYEILAAPNRLDPELYETDHEEAYNRAFEALFRPAIDRADIIIVFAPEGIGEHTQKDIKYAKHKGKPVFVVGEAEE